MTILDNSNKVLFPVMEKIVPEKLGKDIRGIRFIGGGSFGRVFSVTLSDGESIALKAYRVQHYQYDEAEQLQILAENTCVEMPRVLFTYEDDKSAILAMTFVQGVNALNPAFLLKNSRQKQSFAQAVIDGMLQWHSVKGEKFGALSQPSYESWQEFYKAEKQQPWLSALRGLAEKGKFSFKNLRLLEDATELFNSLPSEKSEPVLIHGDLNIMNIMVDPKNMSLTAFIDPCGAMWADREYDLFQLRNMWGDAFGLYETYKTKYKLSEYADFRVAYYGAMHESSMRLKGGLIMPLWEDLDNRRLKKEMKKLTGIKACEK